MKSMAILGSTGSIGTQTIRVLQRNPEQYNVQLLAANANWRLMEEQIRLLRPQWAVMADPGAASELKARVADLAVRVVSGERILLDLLADKGYGLVVAAIVGHSGLLPTATAIKAGSDIALANKEALVMAGHILTQLSRKHQVKLLPLDSEHSAIFQCLEGRSREDVGRLILTASGGPFRGLTRSQLEHVTPKEAVRHPQWQMGAKISVDSATLMNKGLEIIEARWLFDFLPHQIDILIHPQSIIHSMVEFIDGSVLGQMGVPSMELPIQYALSMPRRWPGEAKHFIDWLNLPSLSFHQPDYVLFPCLQLAREALEKGGNAPAVLSTANDVCVDSFLAGRIGFTAIPAIIAEVMSRVTWQANPDLTEVLATMEQVLAITRNIIEEHGVIV